MIEDEYYAERLAMGPSAPPVYVCGLSSPSLFLPFSVSFALTVSLRLSRTLEREKHVAYLRSGLKGLAASFKVRDMISKRQEHLSLVPPLLTHRLYVLFIEGRHWTPAGPGSSTGWFTPSICWARR
jgi:hypothetical protein